MMFRPDNRPFQASYLDLGILDRATRHSITDEDVRWTFGYGKALWIRIYKVVRGYLGKVDLISRDYCLAVQRDEFICDMFDIAHYHKIIGLSEPHDLYVEETTTEGCPIGAETIEAIVGKIDG